MDPVSALGIATSAIALADTANTIARTLMEVYRRYKDGPEDMRRMLLEATATGAVLRNIGVLLRDTDASASKELISEALERCNKSLQFLMMVLDRIDRSPGGHYGRLQQALRDVFWDQQNQIQKALDSLSRARLDLTLAIVGGVAFVTAPNNGMLLLCRLGYRDGPLTAWTVARLRMSKPRLNESSRSWQVCSTAYDVCRYLFSADH